MPIIILLLLGSQKSSSAMPDSERCDFGVVLTFGMPRFVLGVPELPDFGGIVKYRDVDCKKDFRFRHCYVYVG
jgi:hypothetical protein